MKKMSPNPAVKGLALLALSVLLLACPSGASARDAHRGPFPPTHGGQEYNRHVKSLPRSHARVNARGSRYYYHSGVFYRNHGRGYSVCAAPLGAVVLSLPLGSGVVVSGGITYQYYGGTYYRRVPAGYRVVAPPPKVVVVEDSFQGGQRVIQTGGKVRVAAQALNLRTGPGRNFSVTAVAMRGSDLEVLGASMGWLYVRLNRSTYGWCMEEYVTLASMRPKG